MADCVKFSDSYIASKSDCIDASPRADGEAFDGKSEMHIAEMRDDLDVVEETQYRDMCDMIAEDIMGKEGDSLPTPMEPGDKTGLSETAKNLAKQYFDNARVSKLNDILSWVNGLTPGRESRWLHMSSRLAHWFTNQRATFAEWCSLYADDGTGSILNNELASRMSHMQARIQGELERLMPFADDIQKIADEASQLSGRFRDRDDVLRMIGDYAICRHIIEDSANERLIESWEREIDWMNNPDNKMSERTRSSRIRELEENIELLRKFMDDENPPSGIASVGYTKGEARKLMRDIESKGISMEHIRRGADRLVEANKMLLEEDLKTGRISPGEYASLERNQFKYYVPVTSKAKNKVGYINDKSPYYPGSYNKRKGKLDIPDDAFTSTITRAKRVASHIATRDVGDTLMLMALKNKDLHGTDADNGLRIVPLAQLEHSRGMNPIAEQWAMKAKSSGGFVVDRPMLDENGHVTKSYQALVYFDPNWKGKNGISGAMLNDSLLFGQNMTPTEKVLIGTTGRFGQLFTRFRPWFGLVNTGRDSMERLSYMSNRDYIGANGEIIHGHNLLGKYAANVAWASSELFNLKTGLRDGSFDMNSKTGQYWQEYVRYGVHQDYTWGSTADFARKNLLESRGSRETGLPEYLQNTKNAGAREFYAYLKKTNRAALDVLDDVNDYWNNIASFAQFVTLREAGLSGERAARATLDAMDFSQQGAKTNGLRCIFPFVKPIMQSATSLSRVLGLSYDKRGFVQSGWKGWTAATVLGIGFKALAEASKQSMGKDEDGNWRIDQLSLSKLSRGIPFGIGKNGEYFFLNTGYSLPRLVATLVWGTDRVERGLMTPDALAGSMLLTYAQEMFPGNWPEFSFLDHPGEYIIQSICPSVLTPFAEIATNMNSFGHVIKRGGAPEYGAKSDYGGGSSERVYNIMAQKARRMFGLEFYPEQLQHLIQGYTSGAFTVLRSAWEDNVGPSIRNSQHYKDTHLHPFAEALGMTMSFGYADDVARGIFNQAEATLIKVIKDNGIRKTDDKAYKISGSREEKRAAQVRWWRQQCLDKGLSPDMADDIVSYFLAADALKAGKEDVNKYLRTGVMNGNDYFAMQESMEELTRDRRKIYRDFVNNFHMYRR